MVEQSSLNCTGSISIQLLTKEVSLGDLLRKVQQNCIRSALSEDSDGQDISMASTVPLCEASVPQQSRNLHNPFLLLGVQCPVRASTLYRPEINLAWDVAFSTSQGEEPQEVKIGWHIVSPRYSLFMYLREDSELAFVLRLVSQYCRTTALAAFLT